MIPSPARLNKGSFQPPSSLIKVNRVKNDLQPAAMACPAGNKQPANMPPVSVPSRLVTSITDLEHFIRRDIVQAVNFCVNPRTDLHRVDPDRLCHGPQSFTRAG